MKIKTQDNLSFTSKIKFIDSQQFAKRLDTSAKNLEEVTYPWTIETLKKGEVLYTNKILDCIAICLTNGYNSLMAHLGIRNKKQAQQDGVKEFDINNIEQQLSKSIDLKDENLHGFILGGLQLKDDVNSGNTKQLDQIKTLFEKYKIPYSIIAARKDVHYFGRYSLLFNQNEDTLFVTNTLFDSYGLDGKKQKEMFFLGDTIAYNTYTKFMDEKGVNYRKTRIYSSVEKYFKNQFRQVQLNKIDQFA